MPTYGVLPPLPYRFGSASAFVAKTALDLTDKVQTTMAEIDAAEQDFHGALTSANVDEAVVYKEMLTDFQFEQLKLSREYQKIVAEKEAEVQLVKDELKKRVSGDCKILEAPPSSSATKGEDEPTLVALEQSRLQNEVLNHTVKAWEDKLKDLLTEKTNNVFKIRQLELKMAAMEKKYDAASSALKAPAATSPSKVKLPSKTAACRASDQETIENLVAEYTKLSAESQRKQDTQDEALKELQNRCEEYMVKIKAQEHNILMLTKSNDGSPSSDSFVRSPSALDGDDKAEVNALKEQLRKARHDLDAALEELRAAKNSDAAGIAVNRESQGSQVSDSNDICNSVDNDGNDGKQDSALRVELEASASELAAAKERINELETSHEFEESRLRKQIMEAEERVKLEAASADVCKAQLVELRDTLKAGSESTATKVGEYEGEIFTMRQLLKDEKESAESSKATWEVEKLELNKKIDELRLQASEEADRLCKSGDTALEGLREVMEREKHNEIEEVISKMEADRAAAVAEATSKAQQEKAEALAELTLKVQQEKAADAAKVTSEAQQEKVDALAELTSKAQHEKTEALAELSSKAEEVRAAALAELTSKMVEEKAGALAELASNMESEKTEALAELTSKAQHEKTEALAELSSKAEEVKAAALAELNSKMVEEKAGALAELASKMESEKETAQAKKEEEINDLKRELSACISSNKETIESMTEEHDKNVASIKENHANEMKLLKDEMKESDAKLRDEMAAAVAAEQALHASTKEDCKKKISWFEEKMKELVQNHEKELQGKAKELEEIEGKCMERQKIALEEAASTAKKEKDEAVDSMKQSLMAIVESANSERDECKELYMKEASRRKAVHNKLIEIQGNIRVIARVRPVVDAELKSEGGGNKEVVDCTTNEDLVVHRDSTTRTRFEFDRVCDQESTQVEAYELVSPLVTSVLDGYNVCIFAYGQTGSGKTYTMEGPEGNRGVNYRAIKEMFEVSKGREEYMEYT